MKIAIEAMTCGHCVRAITEALRGLDPGAQVEADLAKNQVDFRGNADTAAVRGAIEEAGYVVVSID